MRSYFRCIFALPLQYRRLAVTYLTLGIPALFVIAVACARLLTPEKPLWAKPYYTVFLGNILSLWHTLAMPMGSILVASLAFNLLWTDKMWQGILLHPVNRGAAYLAQLTGLAFLTLLGVCVLILGLLLSGQVFASGKVVDWSQMLILPLTGWIVTLPILSFQAWLTTRFRSLTIPLAVGCGGFLVGTIGVIQFNPLFFFWNYPMLVDPLFPNLILTSLLLTSLFTLLGWVDFRQMDIQ